MSGHLYKVVPGLKTRRLLASVARDLQAVDHADQKFHVRRGRAAFQRGLLIQKLAFKTNGEYLLELARKEKESRDEYRGERRLYAKKFDPFHPFTIPSYTPRQGASAQDAPAVEAGTEAKAASDAAAKKGGKPGQASKAKEGKEAPKKGKEKDAGKKGATAKEELEEE